MTLKQSWGQGGGGPGPPWIRAIPTETPRIDMVPRLSKTLEVGPPSRICEGQDSFCCRTKTDTNGVWFGVCVMCIPRERSPTLGSAVYGKGLHPEILESSTEKRCKKVFHRAKFPCTCDSLLSLGMKTARQRKICFLQSSMGKLRPCVNTLK